MKPFLFCGFMEMENEMEGYTVQKVIEQQATFDCEWESPIDDFLLMKIINHRGAEDETELKEMGNPKRLLVRVIIETKEI